MNKSKTMKIERIVVIVFLVCVFLLGVIKIEDTDTWMHLSVGKYIFEHKTFPVKEPFVYPSLDQPFWSPEWLFGLTFFIAYKLLNVYGVILLKASIITAVFYILLKDSLWPHKNYIAAVVVLTFIVFMSRYRFVERPDIVLMLFLSFAIFALNSFVSENKKYIYFLPVTQILWVNMHPSAIVIAAPFAAFIFGGLAQKFLNNKYKLDLPLTPSTGQLKTMLWVFLVLLAVTLINPYFTKPFTVPFEFVSQDWLKDEIMELQKPTWELNKSPYLLTAAIIVSFLINIRRPFLIHFLLLIPFVYLSFSALRFIFFLGVIGGPIIVRNTASQFTAGSLQPFSESADGKGKTRAILNIALIVFIILSTAFAVSGVKSFSIPGKITGFGVNYDYFPEGALKYLDERKITGRLFNTFQWGGYIIWRDTPKRTVFVDGRGVLTLDLLEKLDLARINPAILEELWRIYNFNAAVLAYPIITSETIGETFSERDLALSSKDWALVYWDDLSLVYLKKEGPFKDIIERDGYRYVKPTNGPAAIRAKLNDKEYLSGLIKDLKRNIRETDSSIAYAYLGFVYNETGRYKDAIEVFSRVRDFPLGNYLFSAYQGLGFAYNYLGIFDKSLEYYMKAHKIKKDAHVMYNIGIAYMKLGDEKKAVEYFEEALKLNKNLRSIYPYLIVLYQKLGMTEEAEETVKAYEKVKTYSEGEEHFQKGLKAYEAQRYELALEEFKQSIKVNPFNPASFSNIGYIYYDIGLTDKAYEYQRNAIDLDPEFANAHYGLALIHRKSGDMEGAKRHWEEYLRIEPKGYFARKAKEELSKL